MRVTRVNSSRINEIDFENLPFGTVFTDHMVIARFRDNNWSEPEIVPYGDFNISPSASVLHYGQAVFEGLKAYKDEQGQILLFRPMDHCLRLQKSALRLNIPPVTTELFFKSLEQLLKLDHQWIIPGKENSLYVRPFIIGDSPNIQASPSKIHTFMIICSPARSYFDENEQIRVMINTDHSRAASGGVGNVKAAGNYAAQFYPTNIAIEKGYQQLIWTDANTHHYIEESGTMNIVFRIGETLVTPPISDRILDGITRKSVITIAKDQGIPIEIRPVKISEIIEGSLNGSLKEIFGVGTAVVVCPISEFRYENSTYKAHWPRETYAQVFKNVITGIQHNLAKDPFGWRYIVN